MHAGVFGEAQHRPLRIIAQRPGRTCRHAGEAQCAAIRVDLDRAEWRAGRQRDDFDGIVRRTMQFAQREPQHFAFAARSLKTCRPRRRGHRRNLAQGDRDHLGIIGLQRGNPGTGEAQALQDGLRERERLPQAGDIVTRPVPQQQADGRCAIGKAGGDALQSNLSGLIDRERQHVRRQSFAGLRQGL